MRSQLSKAARAIPGCLVEGCGKDSHRELARYADMFIGSCSEVEYWVLLGRDIGHFNESDYDRITGKTVEVRRMLFGLRKGIREKRHKPPPAASDPPNYLNP